MSGRGVRVRNPFAVFILGGVDCLSHLLGGPSLQGSVCQLGAGPHGQWSPVASPRFPTLQPSVLAPFLCAGPGTGSRALRAAHPAMGTAQRACGWRPAAPGGSRLSAAVPSVPLAAQLCRRAGLLPLQPICGLAAGRASPRSSHLPLPPALGTHSIPCWPPGLLTGTAHRPLPGGSIPSSPAFCPVKQGLLPQADALPLAKKIGNLAPDSVLVSRQDQCSL